jgi:hypothetical protein
MSNTIGVAVLVGICACGGGEKREPLLGRLENACKKMGAMQTAVRDGARALQMAIDANPDKKAQPENLRTASKLAAQQRAVIAEANRAIKMLKAEGANVAFPEIFDQVRADMIRVRQRLKNGAVGPATQALQADIIDTLKEMTTALTKR